MNKRNGTHQNDKNENLLNSIRKNSRIFKHLEAIRQCRNNIKKRTFDILNFLNNAYISTAFDRTQKFFQVQAFISKSTAFRHYLRREQNN